MDKNRRIFLRAALCGLAGAAATAALPAVVLASPGGKGQRVTASRALMGTFVSITAVHPSQTLAQEACGRALDEMARLAAILNRHDPASPLSLLNQTGRLASPPPELIHVLRLALGLGRTTDGAFDPTVTPVVELVRRAARENRAPDPAETAAALELVDAEAVRVDDGNVRLAKSGMALTFDGTAKGWIADQAGRVLADMGVTSHLIDAGGDLVARGGREGGNPWRVAVQRPDGKDWAAVVALDHGCLATSGSSQTRSPFGHHLVDPVTGRCPDALAQITVRADSLALADGLATGLFVTPPATGWRLATSLPATEALYLGPDGSRSATPGFPLA